MIENKPKWGGGVYTFPIKYGLIINKICKYFGVGSQNFPLKNFSYEFDFGGVRIESRNFRGSTDWFGRNGGGATSGTLLVPISYTPLWVFVTTSLIQIT